MAQGSSLRVLGCQETPEEWEADAAAAAEILSKSIHDRRKLHSGSEIEKEQFLLLRVL